MVAFWSSFLEDRFVTSVEGAAVLERERSIV